MKKSRAIDLLDNLIGMIEDNQDNDYDTAFRMAIEALKAQLSQEGTTKDATSDLISKTETVEHLRRMLEATVPNTDYDEGFVDGVEFCVSTVSTMPIIQPQSTTGQLNDGARSTVQSTDLIDRQQAIDALDVLCQEHRYRIPGKRETYSEYNEAWQDALDRAEGLIFNLPPAQPEPQEGHWIPHESPDGGEQYECSRCGVLWEFNDGSPKDNEAFYCPNCGARMKGATP